MTNNPQELIEYIQAIEEFTEEEKNTYIDMIKNGQDSAEIFDMIEDALQEKLDRVFNEGGAKIDENDPEYQAKHQEMMNDLKAAEDEFDTAVAKIEEESNEVEKKSMQEIDDLKIEEIRSHLAAS